MHILTLYGDSYRIEGDGRDPSINHLGETHIQILKCRQKLLTLAHYGLYGEAFIRELVHAEYLLEMGSEHIGVLNYNGLRIERERKQLIEAIKKARRMHKRAS